jgi:hypothetical protein
MCAAKSFGSNQKTDPLKVETGQALKPGSADAENWVMPDDVVQPESEVEINEGFDKLTAAYRFAVVSGGLILSALLAFMQLPNWGAWIALVVALEGAAYWFFLRWARTARAAKIDEFRQGNGMTPASQLPDVGV